MVFCVVCHKGDGSGTEWIDIQKENSEGIPIFFGLYKLLEIPIMSGNLCPDCYQLIEKICSLEQQLKNCKASLLDLYKCNFTDITESVNADDDSYYPNISTPELPIKKDVTRTETEENESEISHEPIKPQDFWKSVNDLKFLEDVLKSNQLELDNEFSMSTSQRGEEILIYKGFTYRKKSLAPTITASGNGVNKWRCSKYHRKDRYCKGQVATNLNNLCVLKDSFTSHNHSADEASINHALLLERIRTIASNHPNKSTIEILSLSEMLIKDSPNLRDNRTFQRYVQRLRAKRLKKEK